MIQEIFGRTAKAHDHVPDFCSNQGNSVQFNPPATISIEHILPQNPSAGSGWMNDFTEEERYEWTDKIGNLALISRRKNTSQGNLDFADKMQKYFEKNIEVFPNSI